MKRVLVIAHEPDGAARQVELRLVQRGFDVDTHLVTPDYRQPDQAQPWPSLDGYDLIVPMGSIRSLTNKTEINSWIHHEVDLLATAHDAGTPILGVCFGGQLIAEALGGSVENAPVTEIGWYEIESAPGAENPVGPGPWMQWHHDRFNPPSDAEILAINANAVQLFRVGRTVGMQFHPEVDLVHIAGWLASCDDGYLHEHGVTRAAILSDAKHHEARNIAQCHALVDWYLDEVAFPEHASVAWLVDATPGASAQSCSS